MHMDDYATAANRAVGAYSARMRGGSRPEGSGKRRRVAPESGGERQDEKGMHTACVDGERGAGAGCASQSALNSADVIDRFLHGVLPEHPAVTVSRRGKRGAGRGNHFPARVYGK